MYKNLRTLRESLQMTQSEFGKSIGIAKTTYSNYEIGKREPNSDFWIAVASKYDVSIDYLMGFSDNPKGISINNFQTTFQEESHIKKYRILDKYGKNAVDAILNIEYERCQIIDFNQIR